jgi:phosphoserine phosphatase
MMPAMNCALFILTLMEQVNMREIILINIIGKDKPGLIARLTGTLAEHGANILDIGEAVIHDYMALGILIEIPDESRSNAILKDILFTAHKIDVDIQFSPIDEPHYEKWVALQGRERRIITLLGRKLTAVQIAGVCSAIAENQLNIDVITRLSGRTSLATPDSHASACIQMTVTGKLENQGQLRARLLTISKATGIDISFQIDDIYRQNRRLVVFDMDSTLIQGEVIDELAARANVGPQVAEITRQAMNGEIDYRESLARRVALLKGLDESLLPLIAASLKLTEGAEKVVRTLQRLGYKIGIISGGFDYFGKYLLARLGLDYMYANRLEIENGKLTGNILGEIVDGPGKADILCRIARKENISLKQTIAVGDGANDLQMLTIAGLGVAFHAKPIVKKNAQGAISSGGLDGLLYLMGISEREIRQEG